MTTTNLKTIETLETFVEGNQLSAFNLRQLTGSGNLRVTRGQPLPRQFDEYIWFDETRAVKPLSRETLKGVPDTFPFGL